MTQNSELIHTDFNTIREYDQNYRISTEIQFYPSGTYRCEATLWKSNGGAVRGDPLYESYIRTDEEADVEEALQECVDTCKEKMEDIERAKLLEIDVTVK